MWQSPLVEPRDLITSDLYIYLIQLYFFHLENLYSIVKNSLQLNSI